MTWYAASVIFVFKLRTGRQKRFPVWEDVHLIEADTDADAWRKAEELGKAKVEIDDETLTVGDRPAKMKFCGVRKVVTIDNPFPGPVDRVPPVHGTELTYSEFSLGSEKDIEKLVEGRPVSVRYEK
jgi:hypothetical protein